MCHRKARPLHARHEGPRRGHVPGVDRCAPDLVLLDVEPSAWMVSRCCAASAACSLESVPVILLTAKGRSEKVRGLRGGANDYIIKPFDQEELLLRTTCSSTRARSARPPGCPGNLAIAREATQRIQSGEPFAIMYLDIDSFKSFNDTYGYARGDRAIALLSRVLCDAVRALGVTSSSATWAGTTSWPCADRAGGGTGVSHRARLRCRSAALHDAEDAGRRCSRSTAACASSGCCSSPSPWRSSSTRTDASPIRPRSVTRWPS